MNVISRIKERMEVIGADGVHVGTVDRVESGRIKLTKADSGQGMHKGHHHYHRRRASWPMWKATKCVCRQMATWR